MTRLLSTTALILALGTGAAFASSGHDLSAELKTQITEHLTAQGYEVRKIDREDGMIEVYALKDGQRFELYLDAELNIVRTKTDD